MSLRPRALLRFRHMRNIPRPFPHCLIALHVQKAGRCYDSSQQHACDIHYAQQPVHVCKHNDVCYYEYDTENHGAQYAALL